MKKATRTIIRQRFIGAAIAALPATLLAAPAANTLPTNPTVINGTVIQTQPTASQLQLATTPGAIINWGSFSIGSAATVNFAQQNAASAVLNRVTGSGGSEIYGQLSSNGRVFLINTNGIVFGAGSRVDVGGLVASTRNLTDANFLAGNYRFEGAGGGNITLESDAQIRTSAAGGGQVWLFANRVDTRAGSSIATPQGQTVLAAGDRVTVGDNGNGYLSFSVDALPGQTIEHLGTIAAERGAVGLFADSLTVGGRVGVAPGSSGAQSYGPAGSIHLAAASDVTLLDGAALDASGGQYGGGRINLEAGNRVVVARGADVAADGSVGGRIDISANEVLIEPGAGGVASVHAAGDSAAADGVVSIVRRAPAGGAVSSYLPVSTSGGVDFYPSVSFLDDGGFVVVWMEQNAPAGTIWNVDYSTIYARRFDAAGQPVSAPFQVSTYTNYQYDPKVIGLDGGGFLVLFAYKDARPASGTLGWEPHLGKLYGRLFDRNGVPLGADFKVSTDYGESNAERVVQLSGGRFMVTWENETSNYPNPYIAGKRGRIFDAAGNAIGAAFDLLPPTTAAGATTTATSHIVPLDNGGFAQVYQRTLTNQTQVFVQRYNNEGVASGPEIAFASGFSKFFLESAVGLANGDTVLTLRVEDPVTRDYKLHYGIYGANGVAKAIDRPLEVSGSNIYGRLTALADGGFAVVWKHTARAGDPYGAAAGDTDTFTRRFGADGTPIEAARRLTGAGQMSGIDQTSIAAGADGRYLAAWSENLQVGGGYSAFEIRAAVITPDTEPAGARAPIAGALPNAPTYATAPGRANGVAGDAAYCIDSCPAPAGPIPEPVIVAEPVPVAPNPPPAPALEVARRVSTESRLNDERLLTPTSQPNFVFRGEAGHFADDLAIQPVVDQQGNVLRYELVSRTGAGDAAKGGRANPRPR